MELTYNYYTTIYKGVSVSQTDFDRIAERAKAKLAYWERIYTVTYPVALPETTHDSKCDALCAMIDVIYYFECVSNGLVVKSSSIGSVSSSSGGAVDDSPKAQERELLSSAKMYIDIYRGVGKW